MPFCSCKEPELVTYDYHKETRCKLCGKQYIKTSSSPSYVPVKTPWYVIYVHTWGGGGLQLPLYLALIYYALFYPLFTLCIVIGKLNWWWDGLFNKGHRRRWPVPKAKHPKNLWN